MTEPQFVKLLPNKTKFNEHFNVKPAKVHIPTFVVKMYQIIENPSTNDEIHWTEQGDAFIITDQRSFSNKVLPAYFKHNNFASFVRQLNMYDFHKVKNEKLESEEITFKHPYFLRGQKHLMTEIKRKSHSLHPLKQLRMQIKELENSKIGKAKRSLKVTDKNRDRLMNMLCGMHQKVQLPID